MKAEISQTTGDSTDIALNLRLDKDDDEFAIPLWMGDVGIVPHSHASNELIMSSDRGA